MVDDLLWMGYTCGESKAIVFQAGEILSGASGLNPDCLLEKSRHSGEDWNPA
jgi:hypothetical protein